MWKTYIIVLAKWVQNGELIRAHYFEPGQSSKELWECVTKHEKIRICRLLSKHRHWSSNRPHPIIWRTYITYIILLLASGALFRYHMKSRWAIMWDASRSVWCEFFNSDITLSQYTFQCLARSGHYIKNRIEKNRIERFAVGGGICWKEPFIPYRWLVDQLWN